MLTLYRIQTSQPITTACLYVTVNTSTSQPHLQFVILDKFVDFCSLVPIKLSLHFIHDIYEYFKYI